MWYLISTWNRRGDSMTVWYAFDEPRLRRWLRCRRQRLVRWRNERASRRRLPDQAVGQLVIDSLGPVAERHGLVPARPQHSDDVIWCTAAAAVAFVGDDRRDEPDDPAWCVDLWVHVDQRRRTIAVDIEGRGLHEHLTGSSHWNSSDPVPLAETLDEALALVAVRIDHWFDAIIVGP